MPGCPIVAEYCRAMGGLIDHDPIYSGLGESVTDTWTDLRDLGRGAEQDVAPAFLLEVQAREAIRIMAVEIVAKVCDRCGCNDEATALRIFFPHDARPNMLEIIEVFRHVRDTSVGLGIEYRVLQERLGQDMAERLTCVMNEALAAAQAAVREDYHLLGKHLANVVWQSKQPSSLWASIGRWILEAR